MASVRPPREHEDKDWHAVVVPGAGKVRVGWWNHCWRTVSRPVTPKQAAEQGWCYVGLDDLPADQPNY